MGPMSVRENLQVVYQLWLNRAFKKPMLTSHGGNQADALSPTLSNPTIASGTVWL